MITSQRLTKRFGDHVAVKELSFTAPSGAVTGFLGPNGAGKTTTFRMLLGLARPTSGRADFDGVAYIDLARPRETVGAVLEASGFHPARTARNHLLVVAAGAGLPPRRIAHVLGTVGLAPAADKRVGRFSMGMRQRLALASALLGDPPVLVLDEPTNGLDPQGVAWLRSMLRMWADEGRTVLVSSHLLAEVGQVVDHVVIIRDGAVVHEGDADTMRVSAGHRVRCSDQALLATTLQRDGATCTVTELNYLTVVGATPERIGQAAAAAGIAVYELTTSSTSSTLESMFLALTDGAEVA